MGETVRFGVSLDADLLADFDALCARHGYVNRSEAIRDRLRAALVEERAESGEESAGTLTLVYDHHRPLNTAAREFRLRLLNTAKK